MQVLRGDRRVIEQTLLRMGKISVLVAAWCNALVYLDDMNTIPRELLLSQRAQHNPGGSAAADSHDEAATVGDGGTGFCRNRLRGRLGSTGFIGKHFSLHRKPFAS
jgi:hypothetical protein